MECAAESLLLSDSVAVTGCDSTHGWAARVSLIGAAGVTLAQVNLGAVVDY